MLSSVILVVMYHPNGATGPTHELSRAFPSVFRRASRIGGDHIDIGKTQATYHFDGFSGTAWREANCQVLDGRLDDASRRGAWCGDVLVSCRLRDWSGIHDLALARNGINR
jgi:hypothetical protein